MPAPQNKLVNALLHGLVGGVTGNPNLPGQIAERNRISEQNRLVEPLQLQQIQQALTQGNQNIQQQQKMNPLQVQQLEQSLSDKALKRDVFQSDVKLKNAALEAIELRNLPLNEKKKRLVQRIAEIDKDPNRTSNDSRELLNLLETGNETEANQVLDTVIEQAQRATLITTPPAAPKQQSIPNEAKLFQIKNNLPPELQAEFENFIQTVKRGPAVTIDQRPEKSFDKKLSDVAVGIIDKVNADADAASIQIDNLQQLELLDDGSSGFFKPALQTLGEIAVSLGVPQERVERLTGDLAKGEAFAAVAGKMVLDTQMQQAGVMSESDTRLVRSTITNLGNTPQANEFVRNIAISQQKRLVDKASFVNQKIGSLGRKANPSDIIAFNQEWRDHVAKTPLLFRDDENGGNLIFFEDFKKNAEDQGWIQEEIIREWRKLF